MMTGANKDDYRILHMPIVLARKPLSEKTIAANVLKYGTGALNIDGCRVETNDALSIGSGALGYHGADKSNPGKQNSLGRFPANLIHDGSEAVEAEFAKQSQGKRCSKPSRTGGKFKAQGLFPIESDPVKYDDNGGTASRFYYCAKASKKDRAGSKHPTVKPISLMRYLCRLITPPNGTVLDPFAGSGTTGQAAIEEGFKVILIEKEAEYAKDIHSRLGETHDTAR